MSANPATAETEAGQGGVRLRAAALMVMATLVFSIMHGLIRHVSAELHPFEIAFFRNLLGAVVLVPWFVRQGFAPLITRRLRLHGLRGLLNVVSMLLFFYAISSAPLVDVSALSFGAPVVATLFAVLLLGEKIGWRRSSAILFGFAGGLVVLRPGFREVGPGLLAAAGSTSVWAFGLILTKALTRTESAVTITAYMVIIVTPLSLIAALFVWQWPTPGQLGWLLLMGMAGTSGHLLMNQALKEAEAHMVLPLDFVRLIWITLIGYFFFAQVPDLSAWIGGVMIFASAFYIARRERQRRRT